MTTMNVGFDNAYNKPDYESTVHIFKNGDIQEKRTHHFTEKGMMLYAKEFERRFKGESVIFHIVPASQRKLQGNSYEQD